MEDKVFMSYEHRRIWYRILEDGTVCYMVAKGDGTDQYFADWKEAMKWIEEKGWLRK